MTSSRKIRVAVVGVGAFGWQHARVLAASEAAELVAVVDLDPERAQRAAAEFRCEALSDWRELAGRVDAAAIAAPTALHAEIAVGLCQARIDVLVEKPLAPDLAAADRILAAADTHSRLLQVGHLERFNPAIEEAFRIATLPLFFEIHRLGMFSARSLDIDVVLDLMIHDIEILLAMASSPLREIHASGIPILSTQPDIASVRLVFENGCVANLTASRISTEKVRKLRFFQPRQYISIDYARQDGVAIGLDESNQLQFRQIRPEKTEPLARQLEAFLQCVADRRPPMVDGPTARNALAVALRIRAEMERHAGLVQATVAAHRP